MKNAQFKDYIFWRREKDTNKEYTVDVEWVRLKYGLKLTKCLIERPGTWFCLSPFADYKAIKDTDIMLIEQNKAADIQAHADHVRETMEDR